MKVVIVRYVEELNLASDIEEGEGFLKDLDCGITKS